MSSVGSVTYWIHQLQAGDQAALQKLWEGYFHRLVGLAQKRLRGTPRAAGDEEDVALSAFDSFFRRAKDGRFPQLLDRHDLWQLLVLIATRKAAKLAKHERRQKRGGGNVHHASALPGSDGSGNGPLFAYLIGREPEAALAAQLVEDFQRLLDRLKRPDLRSIAVWKLEGWTNEEIAAKIGRSVVTVERRMRDIRAIWEKEIVP
jgi:DNA-directed RNA polymerase specialized sigma24 family protein